VGGGVGGGFDIDLDGAGFFVPVGEHRGGHDLGGFILTVPLSAGMP
jgi:hypothetical protein